MDFDRPNFPPDAASFFVNNFFNLFQACRTDAFILCGQKDKYKIDSDLIKVAEALVQELKSMA